MSKENIISMQALEPKRKELKIKRKEKSLCEKTMRIKNFNGVLSRATNAKVARELGKSKIGRPHSTAM